MDTLEGRTVDRYKIVRAIREGGVGAVYLAEDISLARPVALKFLKAEQAADTALVKRLHQEAKTMARLENPHIVSVYDFVSSAEHVYVAMQYVDGESLLERLERKGRLPLAEVLRVVRDCSRGLAAAHEQGILHRDMKPSNVMLTRRGEVKVADFGLAQPTGDSAAVGGANGGSNGGSTGEKKKVEGTPHYMSPEQCRGAPQDARSDIYSLGVMFYQLLTGEVPFTGANIREVLTRHVKEPPPDVRERFPDLQLSEDIAALIRRMMAKERETRPDAAEVVRLVTAMAQGTSTSHGGVTAAQRGARPRPSVGRRVATVLGALLMAGIAVGVALWFQSYSHGARETEAWKRVVAYPEGGTAREFALEQFQKDWPESSRVADARRMLELARASHEEETSGGSVPGGDSQPAVSDEELTTERDRAENARDSALQENAPDLATEKYEVASKLLREARQLEGRGERSEAVASYREAVLSFADVHTAVERRRTRIKGVNDQVRRYQQLQGEAKRLFIPELAEESWLDAEGAFAEAQALLARQQLPLAEGSLKAAIGALERAIETHGAVGRLRYDAERARAATAVLRVAAWDAGADKTSARVLAEGDAKRQEGETLLAAGDYEKAAAAFRTAQKSYKNARRSAEVASALEQPDPTSGNSGTGKGGGAKGDGGGGNNRGDPGSGETSQAGTVIPPGLAELFSVKPDYKDGILSLHYPSGDEFQEDITILKGPGNVHYEEWNFPTAAAIFTFGGERSGMLLLDAQFVDQVEVELTARFYYVIQGRPFFRVVIMSEDGRDFYYSDFGSNIGTYSNGRRKVRTRSRHTSQRTSPTRWVQKGRDLKIAMSFETDELGNGIVRVTHRFSECAVLKTDRYRKGKIGFWWNNVSFVVKDLKVSGKLDQEWLERAKAGNK